MTDDTSAEKSFPFGPAASWVVYDLANTVYAATVTYLLMDYMDKTFSWGSSFAAGIQTAAMICAGLATPIFASLADRTGKAHVYCAGATLGCIAAMAGFAVFMGSRAPLLACFFISTVFYQAALVFYNSLLPSVAAEGKIGLVSGLGVGLGYLGNIFTLLIAVPVQMRWGLRAAFWVTAAGFLVAAVPFMLAVRDRRVIDRRRFSWSLVGRQFGEIVATVRELPRRRALMWFLIGNFCAVDVLNTAILFFAAFVTRSFEGQIEAKRLYLLGSAVTSVAALKMIAGLAVTMTAFAAGILLGYLTDRIGALQAFTLSVFFLTIGLAGAALFAGGSVALFLIVMCGFGGIGLAGIWTAGRKILIELAPRDSVGRYFGLYGITNKVSVIGCLAFAVVMDAAGPRVAILSQVAPLLFAFFCVYRMKKHMASPTSA